MKASKGRYPLRCAIPLQATVGAPVKVLGVLDDVRASVALPPSITCPRAHIFQRLHLPSPPPPPPPHLESFNHDDLTDYHIQSRPVRARRTRFIPWAKSLACANLPVVDIVKAVQGEPAARVRLHLPLFRGWSVFPSVVCVISSTKDGRPGSLLLAKAR